jgi:hypothetical protein
LTVATSSSPQLKPQHQMRLFTQLPPLSLLPETKSPNHLVQKHLQAPVRMF